MTDRDIVLYGHLNLNILDGSAVWLTTLAETLAQTNSTVHLLLRASVETERLLGRVRGIPGVVIHEPLPAGTRSMLSDEQALAALESLVADVDASILIARGLQFTHSVCQSDSLARILWAYVTDLGFPSTNVSAEQLAAMGHVARCCQRLFLQTEETRGYIEALIPEAAGKTLLMTPTVPDSLFIDLEPPPNNAELKLIYAGKFHPHWRTLEMLELPALLEAEGTEATLTMLGDKFQVPGEWTKAMRTGLQRNHGVHWGGGISRDEVIAAVRAHDVGLSWRTADLDDSLELSTKLLEYAAAGTPPLLNRTKAHEHLLGAEYPLFLDDDSVETVVEVLKRAKPILAGLRSHVQQAVRPYSGSETARRLQRYFERSEPGYVSHPAAKRKTVVSYAGEVPADVVDLLGRRQDVSLTPLDDALQLVPVQVDVHLAGRGAAASPVWARRTLTEADWAHIPLSVDFSDVERPRDGDGYRILTLPSMVPFSDARPDVAFDLLERLAGHPARYQLVIHGQFPWDSTAWADPWAQEQYRDLFARVQADPRLSTRISFQPHRPDSGNWLRDTGWVIQPTIEMAARAAVAGTIPLQIDDFASIDALASYVQDHDSPESWAQLSSKIRTSARRHDSLVVQRQWLDLILGVRPASVGSTRTTYSQLPVSVITPCYKAYEWLPQFVASLAAQTLRRDLFEVVLVFNGPDDGALELAVELVNEAGLQYQIVTSQPGASTARNVGALHAKGAWHTFVDVDDTVSENYLEELWKAAVTPGVVPVATMVDVRDEVATPSALQRQVLAREGVVSAAELWRPMSVTVAKLIPAEVSRRNPFDETLRSGEDVALFFGLFERERFDFDTSPAHAGAVYRRMIRQGSVSRQNRTFDFMVEQRLAVLAILERSMETNGHPTRLAPVVRTMIASQADMVRAYVEEHPDELPRAVSAIQELGLEHFPWYKLPTKTDELIVAYCFAPFSDPSALVSIKRALSRGARCNAISVDMSDRRQKDPTVAVLAEEVVVEHRQLRGPSVWEEWSGIERFCLDGWDALAEIEGVQGRQRRIYSRAMFPASHFLAALIKARRSDVTWTAEFSDPLRKNVFGAERPGPVGDTPLARELMAAAGVDASPDLTIFSLAELLAYALADRLVFTNPHQFSHMLSYLDNPTLRQRVLDRSEISPQPTLPQHYYQRGSSRPQPDPGQRHIAYFGSFYPTRGLGDLLGGLRLLAPEDASLLKVHVFTGNLDVLDNALAGHPYRNQVVGYHPLPYLEFLAAMGSYDVLLINDARTSDTPTRVNPYLPSKLSDYLGSGQRIWGIVEPGSVLAEMALAFSTHLGDTAAAFRVLTELAAEARTGAASVSGDHTVGPGAASIGEAHS